MRMIVIVLALGAIGWTLYQAAGGGETETAIPAEYKKNVGKAQGVEQAMQDAVDKSMEDAEQRSQ